jgi:hypothetical protein
MSQRKASKKSRYSFLFLFAGFVVLQSSSYLLWIFNKYVARSFGCFLVLKKPGTVTITPVAAAPVPIAVEIVDKERSLVLLLLLLLLLLL